MELTPASVVLPAQLDRAGVERLASELADALASPAAVVVLRGASDDVFCTGLALAEAADGAAATELFASVLALLHDAPRPLVAAVDGRCIGGGLGLACACDWVVATDRATFALPELLWGLVPAIIWPVVADRMAPHVARRWTVAAHTRSAHEAWEAGAVDEIAPADQLHRGVSRAVRTLRRLEAEAVREFRHWARESRGLPLRDALARGAAMTGRRLRTDQVRERWAAFTDGGTPWSA
jgi:enoyl-CoA hydratase/carnithine racemase